ncbi:MAG: type II toxin-antitoxin system VapC family toxin [Steroidobacteraceae bacterium]
MQAVDTNVLVRLLTQDDAAQFKRATALFEREQVWVAKTVLLETAWVLRSLYAFEQSRIVAALRAVAGLENVLIEDASAVSRAFDLTDAGVDFADALHVISMGNAAAFATFDRKFATKAKKLVPVVVL